MAECYKNLRRARGTLGRIFLQSSSLIQERSSALNPTLKTHREDMFQGKCNLKTKPSCH